MAAALAIVDRDGVEGLTMRALGRELGADPMAAYHHVPNKEAVLDGVVEAFWADITLELDGSLPWQEQLAEASRTILAGLQRHANALPLMASRPNLSRPGFAVVDRILGLLLEAGLDARTALEMVNAAGEFLIGHAITATSPPTVGGPDLDAAVASTLGEEAMPHLSRVLAEVDVSDLDMDAVFETGLRALIAGIERLADDRGSTGRR